MRADMRGKARVYYRATEFKQYTNRDVPEEIEGMYIDGEFFLDGPVTSRVAILDLDPETGHLTPGARYQPPGSGKTLGRYDLPKDTGSREFNQVHAFATVWKTIQLFEEQDVLGHAVRWAFDSPQLLVVPRAGQMENAFYERDSHSLQFFYFPSYVDSDLTVYTSLIRDIIAHETGHAILDGLAPQLWDSITPQSLALHEAIGDLCGLLLGLNSPRLRQAVLMETGGSIAQSTNFSALAEEFGMPRGTGALRNLLNDSTVSDFAGRDPHELSQVLTGALYSVLVAMHEDRKEQLIAGSGQHEFLVSGKALTIAASQFRRMTLGALDYLPPGEVSFADYGRAVVAANQISHPDNATECDWMCDEFVRRGIVPDRETLQVKPPPEDLSGINLQRLTYSRAAAYDFANSERGRRTLGIPPGTLAEVDPPVFAVKTSYRRTSDGAYRRDIIRVWLFKVWWYQLEDNGLGPGFPPHRPVKVGTTLVWDDDSGQVLSVLSSDPSGRPREQAEQQEARDQMVRRLAYRGLLRPQHLANGPDGRPLRMSLSFSTADGVMQVRSVARVLRFLGEV